VVDAYVETPVGVTHRLEQLLDRAVVGHVSGDEPRAVPDLGGDALTGVLVDVVDDDACALARKQQCHLPAETGARAGDHRNLVREPVRHRGGSYSGAAARKRALGPTYGGRLQLVSERSRPGRRWPRSRPRLPEPR